jgi:hypothetical protein
VPFGKLRVKSRVESAKNQGASGRFRSSDRIAITIQDPLKWFARVKERPFV